MTTTKQTELLSCHCGAPSKLTTKELDGDQLSGVSCSKCSMAALRWGPKETAQAMAIEDWNTRTQSAPEPVQGEAWISATERNPEVERGLDVEVLVAVKRKHNGKIYVFTTSYLNAYPVIYQDQVIQDDDNDQPEITGWFYISDDEETWHRTLSEGDELLAWMYKPAYPLYTAAAKPDAELVALLSMISKRGLYPTLTEDELARIDAKLAELQK